VSPRYIDYVEAHGTATPLGDPIEVEALTQAFSRGTSDRNFCGIGSLKTNVGHMTVAAGVGGLIKVALSLHHEQLVPSLYFEKPNPKISFQNTPFSVVSEGRPWSRGDKPRLAGVSAFGVGGTNAHLVMEEAPVVEQSGSSIGPQLLVLTAKTQGALERAAEQLARHFENGYSSPLADAAFTLAVGRASFQERRFAVSATCEDAAKRLRMPRSEFVAGRAAAVPPEVVFLFPGQSAQYVGMGRNLYAGGGLFKLIVDQCAELFLPFLGCDLRERLFSKSISDDEAREILKRTEFTQPAIFTIEYALARQLVEWGIRPSALIGHSIGEFPAACLAGVFSIEQVVRLVALRGRFMQTMPPGAMLSVRDSAANVLAYLPKDLDLAADNAPEVCVVSGDFQAISGFAQALNERGILAKMLETSHAFHSRSMGDAAKLLGEEVRKLNLSPPRIPIVSTATGTWLTDAEAIDPSYWAKQILSPVRFAPAISAISESTNRVLLEVGPRKTLATLALMRPPDATSLKVYSCLADKADDDTEWFTLLNTIGRLWTEGIAVDFEAFYRGERRLRVALPGYSFERERHWLDLPNTNSNERTKPHVTQVNSMTAEATSAQNSRRDKLIEQLKQLFEQTSGSDFSGASPSSHFMELGIDSLLVTQIALRVKQTFKIPVTFRQLMEELPNFTALATYLEEKMPQEPQQPMREAPPAGLNAVSAPGQFTPALGGQVAASYPMPSFVTSTVSTPNIVNPSALGLTQQLLQLQMAQLSLLQQQMSMVVQSSESVANVGVPQPPVSVISLPQASPVTSIPEKSPSENGSSKSSTAGVSTSGSATEGALEGGQVKYDPQKAFGAIARIYKSSDALTPKQQARLDQLAERYCRKTGKSKAHTQEHRIHHADPRVVTGFKPRIKEIIYPIVTSRAQGCRLWDLDGNEYIDALNGFGSNYFGYSAKFIADALHARIDQGFEIGPQTTLAGESAAIVCELTGMDRAAFCNTGSEAVMGALRIARTVTGRNLVVAFSGSYHGIFDEVIVRDTKTMRSVPAAPGILPEAVQNILVLEYGTEKSLQIIKERAEEIAAVLVEPVQSRRPDFRPRQFLKDVRDVTKRSGTGLIFDEVITGFRVHPGGAQVYYDIKADLATYGKVLGGGMPLGVIAGRNPWMDALDGGQWQYGDDSIPTAGVTYFAGTFVRHPLSMAATHAALTRMKMEGPALQERINLATTEMANELNSFFKSVGAPIEIRHFASLWKTFFVEPQPYGELLFCYLRDRGLHIWDGFPCFLTDAHGKEEIRFIIESFKSAVKEMQAGDFLPGDVTEPVSFDPNQPPVAGARLGRDASGSPAWYVPDPLNAGKYVQI
jgi:acyl transferase domain-containing protein/glutamate-1-semialdehyde aminotransferase